MIKSDIELKQIIEAGETFVVQFKRKIESVDSLEAEIVAFANSDGGHLIIGVNDDKTIAGLNDDEINDYIQKTSNVASQRVNPPIYPQFNTIVVDDKKVCIIYVPEGNAKPYFTKGGIGYAKSGADKRKLDRNELKRLFQSTGDVYADEQIVVNSSIEDIDKAYLSKYYFKIKNETLAESGYELPVLLNRMNILEGDQCSLAGYLFFANSPEELTPIYHVKAVAFYGDDIANTEYRDSIDTYGNVENHYRMTMDFLKRNLRYIQKDKGFNTTGDLEIAATALEEVVMNALFHRDYTKSSPIRVLLFENRLEVISPGCLPNHLTVENVIYGDTVIRNHRIVSFGSKILPYRGLGSGIRRILKEHPKTEFHNDRDGQQFKVVLWRPKN